MTSCDGVGSLKPPATWWNVTGDLGADSLQLRHNLAPHDWLQEITVAEHL